MNTRRSMASSYGSSIYRELIRGIRPPTPPLKHTRAETEHLPTDVFSQHISGQVNLLTECGIAAALASLGLGALNDDENQLEALTRLARAIRDFLRQYVHLMQYECGLEVAEEDTSGTTYEDLLLFSLFTQTMVEVALWHFTYPPTTLFQSATTNKTH